MRLVLLLGFISSEAPAMDQFDLTCAGSTHLTEAASLTDRTEPFHREYRFDLSKAVYCIDACQDGPRSIPEVAPGFFYLSNEHYANDPVHGTKGAYIRRTDGVLISYDFPISGLQIETKATCEQVPFKPFPVPKTRF